ncbi:MAG: DUF2330 domain-containing protein [Polaromonas sp.]|nr:DUF2330 domain-containing protein [Polaromonas sp.]
MPMKLLKPLFAALALTLCAQAPVQAFCGFYAGKADANLFNEASQVVVVRDGQRTVLSMLNDYKGPLSEFALVVPTPVTLKKGQVRVAEKLTFERLDAYSSPRLAEYHDSDPCAVQFNWGQENIPRPMPTVAMAMPPMPSAKSAMRDKALGVTVEARYTLEEYDIVSLSATQSDGLETWLRENGYKIPKGASAALKPYINQGMKFFVAKVNLKEQLKTGYTTLRPLQFAFESEKFMLPMRLGMLNAPPDKPQDLIVYLLTKEGRVESSNYRTVKLPANVNLPHFVKPKFQDFYKAMFEHEAVKEEHRVVFTEYFWDMAWCDPCAANPLSKTELRSAGVFWADGAEADRYGGGEAQPVVLTRLHVRYTANTFPEDLMFTQTKDRQNWQTRYVIQNPYDSSVAQCSDKVGRMDCEAMCKPRVAQVIGTPAYDNQKSLYRDKDPLALQRDCVSACVGAKQNGLSAAARYYQTDLPQRISAEKKTLAQLTGWPLSTIDAMPGADKFSSLASATPVALRPAGSGTTWWAQLFSPSKATP